MIPKTNREFFRFVIIWGLGAGIFLVVYLLHKFYFRDFWTDEETLRTGAICLLAGFSLTLMRIKYLKR